MSKRLAVVTVTYSPGEHLAKCIDSLAEATTLPTTTILADNGSKDGAPELVAAAHPDSVTLMSTGSNIGYGAAINAAAAVLRPMVETGEIDEEFFLITNPDVVYSPGSIDTMIAAAERWPRAGALGPLIRETDGSVYPSARALPDIASGIGHAIFADIWKSNPWSRKYRQNADMDSERTSGWLSGACLLVRWDAFDAIDGFDPRYFLYMEDVDLGDRMWKAGWQSVFVPSAEIAHAQGHSTSAHPEFTLGAHHDSAFRYQADRHPHWWQAPLRGVLWVGLQVRLKLAIAAAKRAHRKATAAQK